MQKRSCENTLLFFSKKGVPPDSYIDNSLSYIVSLFGISNRISEVWLSLVEHLVWDQGVASSNLVTSIRQGLRVRPGLEKLGLCLCFFIFKKHKSFPKPIALFKNPKNSVTNFVTEFFLYMLIFPSIIRLFQFYSCHEMEGMIVMRHIRRLLLGSTTTPHRS